MTADPGRRGLKPAVDHDSKLTFTERLRRLVIGRPRDVADKHIFHTLALIPVLAWVGLGADGLSSSSYGPEEAFRTLGHHTYLSVPLALATGLTILVISAAYGRIIEEFPHGGGGYVVATRLLGSKAGLVSGGALLVDYVLTITVSVAAAGDAVFSLLPYEWHSAKIPAEMFLLVGLTTLNLRGVKESILVLTPVFLLFVVTHAVLITMGIALHGGQLDDKAAEMAHGTREGLGTLGLWGMGLLLVRAYSMGAGTYTGIEAVSNGLTIMREPRVRNGQRTMLYMALSLAITGTGLLVCYLLWDVGHVAGKTMNAVLVERVASSWPGGHAFIIATLLSEGFILVVAAQAGFLDGPRVLANMALDYWTPRRFAALSDRLTAQNGILLMGVAALVALLSTLGDVRRLVIMYSINVFLTFLLSMMGMSKLWWSRRHESKVWHRRFLLFAVGLVMCALILVMTVSQKFGEGGWITLVVTGTVIVLCLLLNRHYRRVGRELAKLYADLEKFPQFQKAAAAAAKKETPELDHEAPTAAILVANYGGLGIHTVLKIMRTWPGHYRNLVFMSVGVLDSGDLREEHVYKALKLRTQENLAKYVDLARTLGLPAAWKMSIGTDAVDEAEELCMDIGREFPRSTYFAGRLTFDREYWYHRLLHNETAYAIERRLQRAGKTMVIFPARVGI